MGSRPVTRVTDMPEPGVRGETEVITPVGGRQASPLSAPDLESCETTSTTSRRCRMTALETRDDHEVTYCKALP